MSRPLLARRYFRDLCDYVVDALDPDPRDYRKALSHAAAARIAPGSLVYLSPRADQDFFFRELYPRIRSPIFLMTGGTGHPNPGRHGRHLEDRTPGGQPKILRWVCENVDRPDPRLIPIPIGIRALFERVLPALQREAEQIGRKDKLVCANFDPATAVDREAMVGLLSGADWVDRIPYQPRRTFAVHRQILEYEFAFCPPGKGVDTYRCWEYLYTGVIPIMKRSGIDPLFDGLPVLLVDAWEEVSEPFLREQSRAIRERFQLPTGAATIEHARRAPQLAMSQHVARLDAALREAWPERDPLSIDLAWHESRERQRFQRAFDEWWRERPRFEGSSFEEACERRSAWPYVWKRLVYLSMPAWSKLPFAWLRRRLYERVYCKRLPNGSSFSAIGWRRLRLLQGIVLRRPESVRGFLRSLSELRAALARDDNWRHAPDWAVEPEVLDREA